MGHYFKWLYDFGHSKHHENISPDAFDGLNITFDDAMLTVKCMHCVSECAYLISEIVCVSELDSSHVFDVFNHDVAVWWTTI